MSTKKNLPAVTSEQLPEIYGGVTFERQKDDAYLVDPAVLEAMEDEDDEGYEALGSGLPFKIVTIRGEDVKDSDRKIVRRAGDLQLSYDPTTVDIRDQPPDVPGEDGMLVSILANKYGRTYWPKYGDPVSCRSLNYIQGIGDPGGFCATCKWNAFAEEFEGSDQQKCKTQNNLFCVDHVGRLPFMLRLGPGSLKVWEAEMKRLRENGTVKMTVIYRVTTRIVTEKEAKGRKLWWIPVLTPVSNVSLPIFEELRTVKKLTTELDATMEIITDQDGNVQPTETANLDDEVPPDSTSAKDDDDLPF